MQNLFTLISQIQKDEIPAEQHEQPTRQHITPKRALIQAPPPTPNLAPVLEKVEHAQNKSEQSEHGQRRKRGFGCLYGGFQFHV